MEIPLHHDIDIEKNMNDIITTINKQSRVDKLKKLSTHINYIRKFMTKSAHGLCGMIQLKKLSQHTHKGYIVFKISKDINHTIEHEVIVTRELNKLRKFLPHFVYLYGNMQLPISNDFVNRNTKKKTLLTKDNSCIPRQILFLEYLNKFPFYRFVEKCDDINIISAQVLHILMGLEIAQNKTQFTHYDLHEGNILMQNCEENSVFLYIYEGEKYLLPTYGFYPKLIDTGISYSKITQNQPMFSNTDDYNYGFQTVIFDKLTDSHHLLTPLLYDLEIYKNFYNLSNRHMKMFRYVPIFRKSGWKCLPNNITKTIIKRIKESSNNYKKFKVFKDFNKEILENLNALIILPLEKGDIEFGDTFEKFANLLELLMPDVNTLFIEDVLCFIRELVSCIGMNLNEYNKCMNDKKRQGVINKFGSQLKIRVNSVVDNYIYFEKIKFNELFTYTLQFVEKINHNYEQFVNKNNEFIHTQYSKTVVKSPLDLMLYYSKNLTPHFEIDKNTIVYIWDSDKECSKKVTLENISEEDLERVNYERFNDKGEVLFNYL